MTKSANTIAPLHSPRLTTIWVVVADAGRARLLEGVGPDGKLTESADLLNPAARLREQEAVSDRKGRVMQGAAGIGQSFEPHQTHADHDADKFAKDLCGKLEAARQQGRLDGVYLIADPSFLGKVRKHLPTATRLLIREEISRDLTRMPVDEIRRVLPAHL